jgi:hypothetical protein
MKFLNFLIFVGRFCPPGSGSETLEETCTRESQRNILSRELPLSRGILEMRTITQELRTILGEVIVDDSRKCGRYSGAAEETLAHRTITVRPQTIA